MRIEVKNLSYIYSPGLPYETKALDENFNIKKEDYFCDNGGVIIANELDTKRAGNMAHFFKANFPIIGLFSL